MLTAHEAPTTYRRQGQIPASTSGVHDGSLPLPQPGAAPSAPHLSRSRGGHAVAPQQLCGEAVGGDLPASVVAGVASSDEDLTDMTCTDGPGRIAKHVLQLAKWSGMPEDGALRIRHNLTQSELAELAGVSRETVNKTLSKFANRGWIQLDHQSMLVCEPERLAHRAR